MAGCGDVIDELQHIFENNGGASGGGTGGASGGGMGGAGGATAADAGGPTCRAELSCTGLQVCGCAGGAYCLPGNAECIAPTAPCPTDGNVLTCTGFQHLCRCATGAYCLAGNAECIAPTAPCPPQSCI
jgi:hypothetical protein